MKVVARDAEDIKQHVKRGTLIVCPQCRMFIVPDHKHTKEECVIAQVHESAEEQYAEIARHMVQPVRCGGKDYPCKSK